MKLVSTRIVSRPMGFICKISEKSNSNKIEYKFITFGLFKAVAKINDKKRSG